MNYYLKQSRAISIYTHKSISKEDKEVYHNLIIEKYQKFHFKIINDILAQYEELYGRDNFIKYVVTDHNISSYFIIHFYYPKCINYYRKILTDINFRLALITHSNRMGDYKYCYPLGEETVYEQKFSKDENPAIIEGINDNVLLITPVFILNPKE